MSSVGGRRDRDRDAFGCQRLLPAACRLIFALCVTFGLTTDAAVFAQAVPSKEPSSSHIFPAGGQRGTKVAVRVGGECLPPGANFRIWGAGVSAPPTLGKRAQPRGEPSADRLPLDANAICYPKEWESQLEIAADAPLGARSWRVTSGWGGTQVRPFIVGELPEFVESEPNSIPDRAERIILPVTLNGQIAGERDIDFYLVAVAAGDVLTCDVFASRIGSLADPIVEVRDPQGKKVLPQEARVDSDRVLAFAARDAGDYLVSVANVGFRGGPEFVYRMTVSSAPYVPYAFPPGGQVGQAASVELSALTGLGGFRTWAETVPLPPERIGPMQFKSSLHAANLVSIAAHAQPVVVSDGSHVTPETALRLQPASVSYGRLGQPSSEDWYRITAAKGTLYAFTCRGEPAASAAMPILTLADAAGKTLARVSAMDAADRNCRLEWAAPADGDYLVRVCDLQHGLRGGPEFLYRLAFGPAEPDFSLAFATDYLNVTQGTKGEVDLIVNRTGGFTGPIALAASSLPEGVQIEPLVIAENQNRLKLSVSAADGARSGDASVQLVGTATIGGMPRQRAARAVPVGLESGHGALELTVQHKPIFSLTCNEAYQYGHRGTIYRYPVQVTRLNGFTGPIVLQICDRQVQDLDGIQVPEMVVPPGATEARVPIYLPETMHANVQHHCRPYVQGHAVITDEHGQTLSMLALCDKRCMIRSLPPLVKLRAAERRISLGPNETIDCRLELERTSNFGGPMEIELVEPVAARGITAEKVLINAGETAATIPIRIGADAVRGQSLTLRFRATGQLPGEVLAVTEATLPLELKSEPQNLPAR